MPAAATQRIVVESRSVLDLSRADASVFGQLLAATLRTQPGVRETVRQLVVTGG